jgi:hypothetical protein
VATPPGETLVPADRRRQASHDLHLRREDGTGGEFAFGSTPSLGSQTQSLDLTPGYYYLWCALPDHEGLGMHARLNVQ